ncbi:MAG: hypothetical protein K2I73_04765 [Eubacterium sp.]|nr:hypothetical protein [Eubacterium sp.]
MKKKFIRIISPITIIVIALLDIAVVGFAIFSVKKIIEVQNLYSIFFGVFEILAIVVAVLVTKETISHGIAFYEDRLEFTGIDDKNVFPYNDITEVETYQDTKASLKKNFIDRHSLIMITLNDDTVTTIDIGLTSKKLLIQFKKELAEHISEDKIKE